MSDDVIAWLRSEEGEAWSRERSAAIHDGHPAVDGFTPGEPGRRRGPDRTTADSGTGNRSGGR